MPKKRHDNLSGWKPLKLEGSVFAGNVEDLIGIEELTDYKLTKENNKTKIVIHNVETNSKEVKVSPKRKRSHIWVENDVVANEPLLKKTKKTKSPKKKLEGRNAKKIPKCLSSKNGLDINPNNNNQFSNECTKDKNDVYDIDAQRWYMLGVPAPIIKALKDQQFHEPTPIQALTLPPAILGHRDILGAAETGSGKTLAFGIPIINGILELKNKQSQQSGMEFEKEITGINKNNGWICSENKIVENDNSSSESDFEEHIESLNENGIGCVRVINNVKMSKTQNYTKPLYALILTPTRELAIQIKDHLTKAIKYTDIKVAVVLGGMAAVKQERILSKGPEIVIATPGRLWELIQQGNPHLSKVDSIKYLAIDETDRMLEKGHFQELQQLLEKINMNEKKVEERQTFVFSATLTMVHDIPEYLEKKKRKHAKSKIQKLTSAQKLQKIMELVGIKNPKIIDVTKKSGILDCKPLPLHASMQQRQRLKNLERFQADENGLLIATDVAARGLDIPNVEHVIHYQVPRTSESYVHRSGRTARAQKDGITVLMMEPSEKEYYSKLCKTLGRTEDLPMFPVIDRLLIATKERVEIAREIDKLELKCRRDNSKQGWLRKAVEEMDLVLEEDEENLAAEMEEKASLKHQLKKKKHQLALLMSKTLFPKGFSGKYPDVNIELKLNDDNQKAIDIMKKAIEEIPKKKKERNSMPHIKRSSFKTKVLRKKNRNKV
ncbi:ATP-dependent RNA helicase DDX24 isoform X2 [Bombus pascuorum]|uniref:ATP-dependent RNA helicase DDX24 isoform X2 n=1 Tax=Bombus pascuorum TaxID=65598 RepID=UPI00298DE783|nr:ATP-dependent RNA helicase DDX24 isoform X2 [Bombus pascuorum]